MPQFEDDLTRFLKESEDTLNREEEGVATVFQFRDKLSYVNNVRCR